MKRAAGFTLIELVIVIVILGILGAVAAPRFINLQGDAYEANINGLKGSLQSAMTLANTRAVLEGDDKGAADVTIDGETVKFIHGFPTANADGILKMLQNFDTDAFTTFDGGADAGDTLTIAPKARAGDDAADTTCKVVYTAAKNDDTAAKITYETDGC
ncbi:pilus assembly FimT family protein [Oceanimonas smirnovii]|uniref:Tfp pilus assembly protein FimT/FimU n=1 Tax=Oceanimonas smirnovii TaxID=264574 RepID=A0ABW7NXN9_9GAMM